MKGSKKRSPQDQTLNAFLGSSLGVISNIGIPTPASKVPETQYLQAEDPTPGAKRVKVRYGPYRLPALSVSNAQIHDKNRRLMCLGKKQP